MYVRFLAAYNTFDIRRVYKECRHIKIVTSSTAAPLSKNFLNCMRDESAYLDYTIECVEIFEKLQLHSDNY